MCGVFSDVVMCCIFLFYTLFTENFLTQLIAKSYTIYRSNQIIYSPYMKHNEIKCKAYKIGSFIFFAFIAPCTFKDESNKCYCTKKKHMMLVEK